jgi:two-component system phosphate regulon sensor histidine kinase PhoR
MIGVANTWAASYRVRLVIGFMAVVTLFAAAWAWSLFGPLTVAVESQQEERVRGVAHAGALLLASSPEDPDSLVRELVDGTALRVTLVAADGRVLVDTAEDPATMENHGDRPEVSAALRGAVGTDIRRSVTQEIEQMYVAVPATYAGEPVAVRASEPLARVDELSAQARGTGLLLLGVAFVLAILVAGRIAESAGGSVERLAEAACVMAAGDLHSSVPAETGSLKPFSTALGELRTQMRGRIEELESQRRSLRTVLDGLSDGVLLLDGDTVRIANRSISAIFRLRPGDLHGRTIDALGLPAAVVSAIHEGLAAGEPLVRELGPDPYHRYVRVTVLPLNPTDRGPRTLVVTADTTDRMRLDRVRRDFVINASHELKTPTAGIMLLAESAGSAARDGDTAQALAFVAQIESEAAHLRSLVLDLLDLSRLESTPAEGTYTDVRRAIDLSLTGHRRAAGEKGLSVAIDDSATVGTDFVARADPTDVAIALDNLLANAIAYTESGGVTVRTRADSERVTIEIEDTGVGIPSEDLPRVFERFYRVDRGRARDTGGTGLGLALVRHVTERSGGSVMIDSEPGSGTRVTLRFPRVH